MWRYPFLVVVYLIVTALPLAVNIGANLEYEYSLLTSYLLLIALPITGLFLPNHLLPLLKDQYVPNISFEMLWVFILGPMIGALPALFLFWSNSCPCSETGFWFWYVMLVIPNWILAHGFFHAVLRARIKGYRTINILIVCLAALAFLVLITTLEIWLNPQKRAIGLLSGFLHGPIYDHLIQVDAGILWARLSHLLFGAIILFVVWFSGQTSVWTTIAFLSVCCVLSMLLAGTFPSTTNGKSYLDRLLPAKMRGEGFTLHFVPKRVGNLATKSGANVKKIKASLNIRRIYRDTAFHIHELKTLFGKDAAPHVDIYVYPNSRDKKLWFGGGATDITDVYTPSVHITAGTWPHPTLRHELVHAMASPFGYHGLGFHPNMAFTEGLAVALAPGERTLSLDEGSAALLEKDLLPPIENLFSAAFWKESGRRAYTVSGSLIRHMIAQFGMNSVIKLYRGHSWEDAVGEPKKVTIDRWKAHVMSTYDAKRHAMYAEALYRFPGVFQDLCPHSKADLFQSRSETIFIRLRQPIGWDPEEDYFPWRLNLDPEDWSIRLQIWMREIDKIATARFPPKGRLLTWLDTLENARKWPPDTIEDVEMALTASDLRLLIGERQKALEILSQLLELSSAKYLGEGLTREIEARSRLESLLPESDSFEWRKYLAGWQSRFPDTTLDDDPWILTYLKFRNRKSKRYTKIEIENALQQLPDPMLSKRFHLAWYKLIGISLMRLEEFELSAKVYLKAAALASPSQKPLLKEHARRARYYQRLGTLKIGS